MRRSIALLGTLATITACERSPFAPDQASLTTSAATYQLTDYPDRVEVKIPYRFVNATGRTLYVSRCSLDLGPVLEMLHEGQWESAYEIFYPCPPQPSIAIRDGTTIEEVQTFVGMKAESHYPKFSVPEGGATYRLVWHVFTRPFREEAPPPAARLPIESRSTRQFAIMPAAP